MNKVNSLWCEHYRPKTVDECVLPRSFKKSFKKIIESGDIPNLLLSGPAGTGKTTIAKVLCDEIGCDWLMINGSLENGIDVLRTKIKQYASTVSLTQEGKKVVIVDEAERLTPQTQDGLKSFMEEFSNNCRFIFTTNHKNRIIPPLHSRCSTMDFVFSNKDKNELMKDFMKRLVIILKEQNIEYEGKVVAALIKNKYPDFRNTIMELQKYSYNGKIDVGILSRTSDGRIDGLIDSLKDKNFKNMRLWVAENSDIIDVSVYKTLYNDLYNIMKKESIPDSVVIISEYESKVIGGSDPEITLAACCTEMMGNCQFK